MHNDHTPSPTRRLYDVAPLYVPMRPVLRYSSRGFENDFDIVRHHGGKVTVWCCLTEGNKDRVMEIEKEE